MIFHRSDDSKQTLPVIGLRTIKSFLGVILCFVIYFIRGKQGTPFYSALAVLQCMQPYTKHTRSMALQRTVGTLIGAFYGLIVILLNQNVFDFDDSFLHYLLISLCIIPLIHTTVIINKTNASYFSCVVYLSIVINHLGDANPYLFVFNRVLDTMIGIVLAFVINIFEMPRRKQDHILFVSGLDDTLLTVQDEMTPFSKIELNRMLERGLNFTIATQRTPASFIESLKDVDLNLPIVCMDGAALYDMKKHTYQKVIAIPYQEAKEIYDFIQERDYHVFTNVIIEDLLLNLYGDFKNPVEKEIYDALHHSLYRNYIKGTIPDDSDVAYFMVVDTSERTTALYESLKNYGYVENYKILHYPSRNFTGYSYLKIYHKDATRTNMIHALEETLPTTQTIRFGSVPEECDILIDDNDGNTVIKKLKNLYAPFAWKTKK